MRKYLSIIVGIVVIAIGIIIFRLLNISESETPGKAPDNTISIQAQTVRLSDLPYVIEATGTLEAKEKIELYSEVQGILLHSETAFKIGNTFSKGQNLISIDNREHLAQIKSSRSDLINQMAIMLPDMELDYPQAYKKWEAYLKNLDINAITPKLPNHTTNEEKLFVSGKNIYKTYYTIKNLEERLSKYYIRAPFSGIVTESNVNTGTLVRSGQKLGEFIDDSIFELQLSIPASENRFLKKGTEVNIKSIDGSQSFTGYISRVNGKIEQSTQTVSIIVTLRDRRLKDGQYLKAQITGSDIANAFSISNNLILEGNTIYVIENNALALQPIEIVNHLGDNALVKGLENGMVIVTQTIANAYPGMPVKIAN